MNRLGRRWNWGLAWLVLRGRVLSVRVDARFDDRATRTVVELSDEQARRWGR